MRRKYTEGQIVFALKQNAQGIPAQEICRKLGVSEQSFYKWKRQYGSMDVSEIRRLRLLEEENKKLKQVVAELTLDKHMLQDVLSKNF